MDKDFGLIFIPLPAVGRRDMTRFSKRAAQILRHGVAKKLGLQDVPVRDFKKEFPDSLSAFLAGMVLGSDKVRFGIIIKAGGDPCALDHRDFQFLFDDKALSMQHLRAGFDRIENDIFSVRAIQGQSYKIDMDSNRPLPKNIKIVYHGTSASRLNSIETHGLTPGGRGLTGRPENYFSARSFKDVKPTGPGDMPGYRWTSEATIEVDVRIAESHGVEFYVTDSNAVL